MASNNKRKAKKIGVKRTEPIRYDQILIVTEDTKSSVEYLKVLWAKLSKDKCKALQESVKIYPSHEGSSPDRVLGSAENKNEEMDGFDEIYCVMDVDSHQLLNSTLQKIRSKSFRTRGFQAIVSNPCFEYWILLHSDESDAPFNRKGKKSPCDCVQDKIKKNKNHAFNKYQKGSDFDWRCALSKIEQAQTRAISRSERILGAQNPEDVNPSTNFHCLINRLIQQSSLS